MKVGDRVILQPPYGDHIGKEAVIVKKEPTVGGSAWFIVELDDGKRLLGPATHMRKV